MEKDTSWILVDFKIKGNTTVFLPLKGSVNFHFNFLNQNQLAINKMEVF